MSKYSKIIYELKNANSIAIFMHINPDCDCMGSAIALSSFLKKDGKRASFFSPDLSTTNMISKKYGFLPYFDLFNIVETDEFDLAIAVDTSDAGRLGDIALKKFSKIKNKIVIDHHEIHEDFAKFTYRESNSASTTQILYKIMCEYNKNLIDKEIATLLYAGLVTDSGGFIFENCTFETYHIAGELVSYGIEHSYICEKLLKSISQSVFKLRNRVLSNVKFYEDGRIGVIVFRIQDFIETNTSDIETDGIINFVKEINGVELAISIAEIADKAYKISFRSKNAINSALCAKCFGGGGHKRAAGCRVYGYFEDVYEKVLSASKEMINND